MSCTIEVAESATPELLGALNRLVPQLSSNPTPLERTDLEAILDSPACTLFVARAGGEIVGTLSLVVFSTPGGRHAWIEDVIVDGSARGSGVGEALTRAAIARARELGARSVDLTSRPSRESANRLYQRVGFVPRDTNVYRYSLGD